MLYELNDILFFLRSLKDPSSGIRMTDYISFVDTGTRSANTFKLKYFCSKTNQSSQCSYFTRLPRLWNSFPRINLDLPFPVIKKKLVKYLWSCFISKFESFHPCTFYFVCPCNCCTAFTYKPLVLSKLYFSILSHFLSLRCQWILLVFSQCQY